MILTDTTETRFNLFLEIEIGNLFLFQNRIYIKESNNSAYAARLVENRTVSGPNIYFNSQNKVQKIEIEEIKYKVVS